jgi:tRNA-specific 2-thiouridylase
MSGGVDSSVAAHLMQEGGYECIGITLKLFSSGDIEGEDDSSAALNANSAHKGCCSGTTAHIRKGCCSLEDVNDAREVAYRLGMPHYVLNFADDFKKEVIGRFIDAYERGATPNPCIDCNRHIKFDRLLKRAKQLEFDFIVTGHYARVEKSGTRYVLKKAIDHSKDQSYVLFATTQAQLSCTRFPLGSLTKGEVRKIAEAQGFINAQKHDSQDICFVPDRDYAAFIERYTGRPAREGAVLSLDGKVLGRHKGIIRYTIGQRRGLGIALNEPVYVASKSVADNTVTLGPEASLYTQSLTANNINLIAYERLEKPVRVRVKTRYLQAEQGGIAEQLDNDSIRVVFDKPQRAVTPGQAAVLYDGDVVVGGGTITGTE